MAQQTPFYRSLFGVEGDAEKVLNALSEANEVSSSQQLFESRADSVLLDNARAGTQTNPNHYACIRAYEWVDDAWIELSHMQRGLTEDQRVKVAPFVQHLEEAYNALQAMRHAVSDTFGGKIQWDFWGNFDTLKTALTNAVNARKDF
jgi:hypothetical protein